MLRTGDKPSATIAQHMHDALACRFGNGHNGVIFAARSCCRAGINKRTRTESREAPMEHEELTKKIDAYLEDNWETMVDDIATLVRIPSFQEEDKAAEGAPFGPGPKEALTAALKLAGDMGFKTHDAEGYIGFADFPGKSETQLGIIGHMDVVPAGPAGPSSRMRSRARRATSSDAARSTTRAPAWWRCTP